MLSLLHPLGVVFNLVGPEDQLVRAAVKLVRNHFLEMLEDRMETQDLTALARLPISIQKQIQFTDFIEFKSVKTSIFPVVLLFWFGSVSALVSVNLPFS